MAADDLCRRPPDRLAQRDRRVTRTAREVGPEVCRFASGEQQSAKDGTEGLRRLIRKISQRIAGYNPLSTTGHTTVRFPSDGFEFEATSQKIADVWVTP